MLPNSSFDACSSARKTFVYARMLAFEDNRFDAKCVCVLSIDLFSNTIAERRILLRVFTHSQIGTAIHATILNNT